MLQYKLDNKNSILAFDLKSAESGLLIKSISIHTSENRSTQNFDFINQLRLTFELSYVVYKDPSGKNPDDIRQETTPIKIHGNSNQLNGHFDLDLLIKNQEFTIGINPIPKFYSTLKIKLEEVSKIEFDYYLLIDIVYDGI
ncbi:MAG: hypothetical protein ORN56_05790 [Chitinophagales bacterium]|jgi:hypothetical protein|nr:hypothetical protein [Chitinophagales bacterium]